MSTTATSSAETPPADLFDKYLLPKAALTVILASSLVGVGVTLALAGRGSPVVILAKWVALVSLGVLTGGLVWKHAFVTRSDVETSSPAYTEAMFVRFAPIEGAAAVVLAPAGLVTLGTYWSAGVNPAVVVALGGALVALVGFALVDVKRDRPAAAAHRSRAAALGIAFATAAVALTAVADVALAGRGAVAAGVRLTHLAAFAVWIGGAVWNIFVAVPSGQERSTVPVIQAAGKQLERFRWAVRVIIPTLLVTGLYQAYDALGATLAGYLGTTVGLAVLSKLGLVVVLVGIFLACPMWKACSPIDGVCDLDDLETSTSPTPVVELSDD